MKIGLFSDTFLPIADGVGRVVLAYANTLSAMGNEVTVSTPMHHFGHRGKLPFQIIDYLAVKLPTAKQYKGGSPLLDTHYAKRIQNTQLDIVHAHSPFIAGQEGYRIAKSRGLPLVASFHSKYYDDFYKLTKNRALALMLTKGVVSYYEKCDEVWAVSETSAEVLESYGYSKKVIVMPNGVEMRTADEGRIHDLKSDLNKENVPLLLFVGQMDWKKNIRRTLEACSLLKKRGVPFKLILAGQGPDAKAIKEVIEELGIFDQCRLLGHISDSKYLDALYSMASLFVFPSLYDNAPMVVREAAVMKTPSVLIKGSCAAEIVQDGVNGFTCFDSSESLADKIEELLFSGESVLKTVGENAHSSIPVPWERILKYAEERYQNLLDQFHDNPPKRVIKAREKMEKRWR